MIDLGLLPSLEPRVHKMLGHPLRYAVITKLGEHPRTCRDLAEALGEDPKRVSEALEALRREDMVEVVAEDPGPRGGLVPSYSAGRYVLDPEDWESLPQSTREETSFMISRLLMREVFDALRDGTFDSDPKRVLIRRPIWIDDQGAGEIDAILVEADERVAEVETRAAQRPTPRRRFLAALLSFPSNQP